jgi:hypothetical protein
MDILWEAFAQNDHAKALELLSSRQELYFGEDQVESVCSVKSGVP